MRKRTGFTLIELLIVVAIIAILAAIAVPNFLEAQIRARVSACKNDLRTLALAWETYRVDYGRYPPDYDGNDIPGHNPHNAPWDYDLIGEWWSYTVVTTPVAYLSMVPRDIFQEGKTDTPKTGALFEYWGKEQDYVDIPEWHETGTFWFMIGYGPDRTPQLNGFDLDFPEPYIYDPTNGTISYGDIARSNVRNYPAD